jgi:tripartite-type tricarboxylate transporter receptor subunit TctC
MKFEHVIHGVATLAAGATIGVAVTATAQAQVPPTIRVLVGFGAGGGTDVVARIVAEGIREQLKNNIVVENRPGAGGAIAAQGTVNAPANQPTLLVAIDHQTAILQHIMKDPGFNAERDLIPIGRVATYDMCLAVHSSVTARNIAEYAAAAKADATLANVAVPAPGSNAQFIGHFIGDKLGAKLVPVPYKGAAPAMGDLAGGQVKSAIMPCDAFFGLAKAGTVRILGIAGDKRSTRIPDVPAMSEHGVNIPATSNFLGIYAPRSMDPKVVTALIAATRQALASSTVVEKLNGTGMFAAYAPPEDLTRFNKDASAFWGEQVKASGFAAQ